MSEIVPHQTVSKSSAIANLARVCDVTPDEVFSVLSKMVMPGASGAEMVAFSMVCAELGLSPMRREVHAMKGKNGQFGAIVSIDGWLSLINRHPDYDGMEIEAVDNPNTGKPFSCTVRIHHKKRSHPIVVTEYFDECRKGTEPWSQWPRRMLRHRAIIQAARVAFGFAGIIDEDEAGDLRAVPASAPVAAALSPTAKLNARISAPQLAPAAEAAPAVEAEVVEPAKPQPEEPKRGRRSRPAPAPEAEKPPLELSDADIESLL